MSAPTSTPRHGEKEHKIADRLHSVAIHLLRRLRREDASLGISAARLSALSLVGFGRSLTIGQMAAAEDVTPPTMTRLVAALEADGLVRRTTDQADRRVVRVEATAAGRRMMQRGRTQRTSRLAAQLHGLEVADLEVLARAAAILEGLLQEHPPRDR